MRSPRTPASSSPAAARPGLSPGVKVAALALVAWEALLAVVLWRLGVIG